MNEELTAIDVPQAENVALIRSLTELVARGMTNINALAARLGVTPRHATYCQNTARILGWIELRDDQLLFQNPAFTLQPRFAAPSPSVRARATDLGTELLLSEPASSNERTIVYRSMLSSASITRILGPQPSTVNLDRVTARIQELTALSFSTSQRRARALQSLLLYAVGSTNDEHALDPNANAYLARYLEHARFTLILDWSFSSFARTRDGDHPPSGHQLSRALAAQFSSLSDPSLSSTELLTVAQGLDGRKLHAELSRILTVDSSGVPSHYRLWFEGPWQRLYYLGVDTLPQAMRGIATLPRPLSISYTTNKTGARPTDLPVVQLHGCVSQPNGLQLRPEEDAAPTWDALAVDVLAHPLLIVANAELSPELIRILDVRRTRERFVARELRPRCFLISPAITDARETLLREQNIHWIPSDSARFASFLEANFLQPISNGVAFARRQAAALAGSTDNIVRMVDVVGRPPTNKTNYLLGYEPHWSDIASGRAIARTFDDELGHTLRDTIRRPQQLCILTGTAGSGKSTSLMRAAYSLAQEGFRIGYVASDAEVSMRQLRDSAHETDALFIDDVDRYGKEWPSFAQELVTHGPRLVCAALRSTRLDSFRVDKAFQSRWSQHTLPWLSDSDIGRLLVVLEREHRLGRLKGMNRDDRIAIFQQHADRQLLVAMIEATSGRRFDEKIESEWSELGERAKLFYALVSVASSMRYSLSRRELLLAVSGDRTESDLSAFDELVRINVLSEDQRGRIRARHRVIADKLLEHLGTKTRLLIECFEGLAYAIAVDLTPNEDSWRSRRFLRAILNHDHLQRVVDSDGARRIYANVEGLLHWDYHYWLQRGSLEVEDGDIRLAEQFLEQAFSINDHDRQVVTEYAYMLMKKAASHPTATDAEEWLERGKSMLLEQIASPGRNDEYPYHVLGSSVLRWTTRSTWPIEKKRKLLREALRVVQNGSKSHPRSHALTQLEQDMRKKSLELDVF